MFTTPPRLLRKSKANAMQLLEDYPNGIYYYSCIIINTEHYREFAKNRLCGGTVWGYLHRQGALHENDNFSEGSTFAALYRRAIVHEYVARVNALLRLASRHDPEI